MILLSESRFDETYCLVPCAIVTFIPVIPLCVSSSSVHSHCRRDEQKFNTIVLVRREGVAFAQERDSVFLPSHSL